MFVTYNPIAFTVCFFENGPAVMHK